MTAAQKRWRDENPEKVRTSLYAWRKNNPEAFAASQARGRKRRVEAFNRLMAELKSGPCVDCGRGFPPEAMDFDHVRGKKLAGVAQLRHASREKILAEISKCDLVCACCHRIRTHARRATKAVDFSTATQYHRGMVTA